MDADAIDVVAVDAIDVVAVGVDDGNGDEVGLKAAFAIDHCSGSSNDFTEVDAFWCCRSEAEDCGSSASLGGISANMDITTSAVSWVDAWGMMRSTASHDAGLYTMVANVAVIAIAVRKKLAFAMCDIDHSSRCLYI
jgi:hypothetical protein